MDDLFGIFIGPKPKTDYFNMDLLSLLVYVVFWQDLWEYLYAFR